MTKNDMRTIFNAGLNSITDSTNLGRYLEYSSRLYKYSFDNIMLLYNQNPDGTMYASYEQWNSIGRYITKNSKGFKVYKKTPKNDYVIATVFDVSQTKGTAETIPETWNINKKDESLVLNEAMKALSLPYAEDVRNQSALEKLNYIIGYVIYDDVPGIEDFCKTHGENIDFGKTLKAVKSMVTYTILCRAEEDHLKESILEQLNIENYINDKVVLSFMGSLANKNTKKILNVFEPIIKEINKQKENSALSKGEDNYERGIHESRRISANESRNSSSQFSEDRKVGENDVSIHGRQQKNSDESIIDPGRARGISNKNGSGSEGESQYIQIGINDTLTNARESDTNRINAIQPPDRQSGGGNVNSRNVSNGNRIDTEIDGVPEEQSINIPIVQTENYHIPNEFSYDGGIKARYSHNVAAIKLLKELEVDKRDITADEQAVLAKYVGWGGIPQVFNANNDSWANEYQELKSLLTDSEYDAAKSSTLNAFYTNTQVISQMYSALKKFGFEGGNILEPSMGTGNFFGMLPEELRDSKLTGIEIDDLTGKIAKHLYPNANIQITGFEKVNVPDNYYDVAIGNVPFGNYKLNEARYNKYNFLIHDHFFAKAIDKVQVGGIVAFISSKGTLDKANSDLRKHLCQRAELVGAIRLPNNAFKAGANTEVTTDIIFLKKREILSLEHENWIDVSKNEDEIPINNYFIKHPEMLLGKMTLESTMYGNDTALISDGRNLKEALEEAINNLPGNIFIKQDISNTEKEESVIILPELNIKNNAFFLIEEVLYQRDGSQALKLNKDDEESKRIRELIKVKDAVNTLLNEQLEGCSDERLKVLQTDLNTVYDDFTKQYGEINSRTNDKTFSDDPDYLLLCSLENIDNETKKVNKAAIFTERTIKLNVDITHTDTAAEALAVCLNEKGYIDIEYMSGLVKASNEDILNNLQGIIFKNPEKSMKNDLNGYETADEYLSGNVRLKLEKAIEASEKNPMCSMMFSINIEKLTAIQPKDLNAGEIEVKLGSTWIPPDDIKNFIIETLNPPSYSRRSIDVQYEPIISEWKVDKNVSYSDISSTETWGTKRINAYDLIELSLNLKIPTVYDTVYEDGKERRVINTKDTTLTREKQEQIKNEFKKWIFDDPERRERLVNKYNKELNCNVVRQYDGAHLTFPGMAYNISLNKHQKNGAAHILYGETGTLLAHCVGAGKTWTMAAAAMELKRLGLANKILIVVPNHLTAQWGKEWLQIYPATNILVASKKDFTTENRKKFASKIATGNYDAIIIGHSAFGKIAVMPKTEEEHIRNEIGAIEDAILNLARKNGKNDTRIIKRLEATKKNLEASLQQQLDVEAKDNVIFFEQLGIDRLFIDEAHEFKNLYLHTKMQNIAGIPQTKAKKSADLYMKIKYLNKLNNSDNSVVFATGTPVSNSMTEMFTMQRYLQGGVLDRQRVSHFDAWASNFGEVISAFEVAPDGSGFRTKTRFAQFVNLPELMNMFRKSADIQTAEMLKLPIPELKNGKPTVVSIPASDFLKDFIQNSLIVRSQAIKDRRVDPSVDNMLKVTTDGRKVAIDPRTYDPNLPDLEISKINVAVKNIYNIWNRTKANKSAQLVFCDCSTPSKDTFNLYDDMKNKLIASGVPENEIKFIHDAKDDTQKTKLFSSVRSGKVRILIGSTAKMGAGTNVQEKLIALHHIDVPWRPSDIEQREGRILRQGNKNKEIEIFRYVTEGSFDAYSWQTIETKQKFISQVMSGDTTIRKLDDMDAAALNYAEIKAIASGNPLVLEKMEVDTEITRLKMLEGQYNTSRYSLQDKIAKYLPLSISNLNESIAKMNLDKEKIRIPSGEEFKIEISRTVFDKKSDAGDFIINELLKNMATGQILTDAGSYAGLQFDIHKNFVGGEITFKGNKHYTCDISTSGLGTITKMENVLKAIPEQIEKSVEQLGEQKRQLELAKVEVQKPFMHEGKLSQLIGRQAEINAMLDLDAKEKENSIVNLSEESAQSIVSEIISTYSINKAEPTKKMSIKDQLANIKAINNHGRPATERNKNQNRSTAERDK